MWTRKSVKQKGKKAFFGSFWKCVLVAIILCIAVGTASTGASYVYSIPSSFSNMVGSRSSDEDRSNNKSRDLNDPGLLFT